MFGNWTFGWRLGLGFAVATVTLLVVAFAGYRSTQTLIENNALVAHTHEVQKELAALLVAAQDVETSARGFAISGKEEFLAPFEAGATEATRALDTARRLTADSPNHQRRLDELRGPIQDKLTHTREYVQVRRTQGAEAALALIRAGDGRRAMDQIRGILGDANREEAALLVRREAEAASSSARAQAVILWGSLVGVALVAFLGMIISRSLTRQVGSAVRNIRTSSTELQSAANQQATGAREQSTAMNEISTTISELLATSRQIAESAQRVAQVAEQTAENARSGDVTVQKSQKAVGSIQQQVEVIVGHMLELGKKSQRIGSVLDIVSELAEQTNILAINATIEAAGAGEAGKRFGVVADEIRKLADRVTGSTKEIRALIEDVRGAVNTTVMTTETGSKAVDAGARQFSEVAAAFVRITQQVSTATEAAREIELSTKQQATAVEQVNVAITNVAQASKETEISTSQTLRTASELAALSFDLLRLVQTEGAASRPAA